MALFDPIFVLADLGGPVVLGLAMLSVVTLALVFYKVWQFAVSGVGRHEPLAAALQIWQQEKWQEAGELVQTSRSYLAPIVLEAMQGQTPRARLEAELDFALHSLSRGFRLLDMVAQIAPLLGLFGTVLGMIEAFQALQDAGAAVDPSLLAGGIWVALLTTAVGLAVAMPTSVLLSWFDGRMEQEQAFAALVLATLSTGQMTEPAAPAAAAAYHHA